MSDQGAPDTSQAVVQTYVPAYQRDEWDTEAEELGMSRSEYVKTMVQAGRRGFGGDPLATDSEETEDETELTTEVVSLLEEHDAADWDELLAGVTGDIEQRLDDALQELQEADRIRYSGRDGGYVLVEDS